MKKYLYAGGIFISSLCFSQETGSKIRASFFDGIAVAGCRSWSFLNFTGPNISFKNKDLKLILGMLPSLRIKEDRSSGTKNSLITPNLGAGLTAVYKKHYRFRYIIIQNTTQNGSWKIGIGIGYSFK
jgi:hypothetical protein